MSNHHTTLQCPDVTREHSPPLLFRGSELQLRQKKGGAQRLPFAVQFPRVFAFVSVQARTIPTSPDSELFALDRNQLHLKNQRGAGPNVAARAALAIG